MKLYYGSYGHHPSGKQYVYLGSDNYRTGQNVLAPVTNKWTGKNYNTMFTIQRTSKEHTNMAQHEIERLTSQGIRIKTIGGRGTMDLPGAQDWASKSQWKQWSDLVYEEKMDARLKRFANTDSENDKMAKARLIAKMVAGAV